MRVSEGEWLLANELTLSVLNISIEGQPISQVKRRKHKGYIYKKPYHEPRIQNIFVKRYPLH